MMMSNSTFEFTKTFHVHAVKSGNYIGIILARIDVFIFKNPFFRIKCGIANDVLRIQRIAHAIAGIQEERRETNIIPFRPKG